MADTKITALTALTAADPANDVIPIVDVSDTSMAASGTTKKISVNNILGASGTATLASATITGDLTTQGTQVKLANQTAADCTVLIGPDSPSATRSGRIGFITSSTEKNWFIANNWNVPGGFEITQSTTAGGSTMSSNPTFRISSNNDVLFLDGAGGTRMTLNSTGLGIGVSPAYKLDVQGSGIRLNSGSATGFAILRLGGTASDSFFGFAGNANDIVTGSSAGDTVIGSNKAGANIRFISGNGVLNATLDASGNLLVGTTSTSGSSSNATSVVLGSARSANGTVSATTAVATTIFSITAGLRGRYEVVAMIPNSGSAALYTSIATVIWDGSTGRVVANNGTNLTITLSGSDVQITQTAGTTQTVYWSFLRISLA